MPHCVVWRTEGYNASYTNHNTELSFFEKKNDRRVKTTQTSSLMYNYFVQNNIVYNFIPPIVKYMCAVSYIDYLFTVQTDVSSQFYVLIWHVFNMFACKKNSKFIAVYWFQ